VQDEEQTVGLRRYIADPPRTTAHRRPDGVDDQTLRVLHARMALLRAFDERALVLHRQGVIGTYAPIAGHEALQAGSAGALEDRDWLFPSYREHAIGTTRGIDPMTVLAWWSGHPHGWWDPREHRVASICVPVATHVPHAAGLAWGLRLRNLSACAAVYFGDGATSEGAFHEGANFAAVFGAPLVLVCNNNAWAISTPIDRQTRARTLADKAVGYGMPATRVDGRDVLAVYVATREAAARARAGGGPTFVEAVSYRVAPHATADDPGRYMDPARVATERANDPLERFERFLVDTGVAASADLAAVCASSKQRMDEAEEELLRLPPPDPAVALDGAAPAAPVPETYGLAR
jgi:pyruvate dehydrogenase E1 component alpha subunit